MQNHGFNGDYNQFLETFFLLSLRVANPTLNDEVNWRVNVKSIFAIFVCNDVDTPNWWIRQSEKKRPRTKFKKNLITSTAKKLVKREIILWNNFHKIA